MGTVARGRGAERRPPREPKATDHECLPEGCGSGGAEGPGDCFPRTSGAPFCSGPVFRWRCHRLPFRIPPGCRDAAPPSSLVAAWGNPGSIRPRPEGPGQQSEGPSEARARPWSTGLTSNRGLKGRENRLCDTPGRIPATVGSGSPRFGPGLRSDDPAGHETGPGISGIRGPEGRIASKNVTRHRFSSKDL